MCRLFGFRSVLNSQVHSSLVKAENALMTQSAAHPDGWGVAYYVEKAPHLVKSIASAMDDRSFQRLSGIVSSQTVLAHIRKATLGNVSVLNTHPFQHGKWTFAHNGNIKDFSQYRDDLVARIASPLRSYVLGDTDSEVIFYLLLSQLMRRTGLDKSEVSIEELADATVDCIQEISSLVGPFHPIDAAPTETYLTFIITNGSTMLAHQGGKGLFFSTYKKRCPDRASCPSFSAECEAPTQSGDIKHLVISSEKLQGENIWVNMQPGDMVGVDWRMRLMNRNGAC